MEFASSRPMRLKRPSDIETAARRRPRRKYRTKYDSLTEPQRELAARFLPMARGLARPLKYLFPHWRDEFESASCLALVEAARSFDPDRNIKFATFARFRIRGALMDVGREMLLPGFEDEESPPGVVTLTPFNEEHGKVLVSSEPPPVGDDVDDIDAVEHWLRKLPRRHAALCRLYYVHGKTQAEIAGAFGCSQSEVTRLHKKSIELLSEPYTAGTGRRRRRRRAEADPAGFANPCPRPCSPPPRF